MSQNNMDDFEVCAAFVLDKLYQAFPQPIDLNSWQLHDEGDEERILRIYADHPRDTTEHAPAVENTLRTYRWTIQFLIDEGFIRDIVRERKDKIMLASGEVTPEAAGSLIFLKLVLTAKGLAVLNKVPKLTEGKPVSFIQRIRDALSNPSKEIFRDTITGLITQSVIFGIGHIG